MDAENRFWPGVVLACVWALDARTSRELWAFTWTSKGGIHLGNRGVGISGNALYFETPDCNLVSLNLADGKKRWSQPICDLDQMYYASVAPLVVKNHIITGVSGDDLDRPGFLGQWHEDSVCLLSHAREYTIYMAYAYSGKPLSRRGKPWHGIHRR